jgi:hypothetical protein
MSELWTYFQVGLYHVLSYKAYDHILFLVALMAAFSFKDWRKVLILITIFTVGHTLALFLSVFGIIYVKENVVEFLIPITIFITAIYNIIFIKSTSKNNGITLTDLVTLFFGIIHGLGFSNYIKSILSGGASAKIIPLSEFALGIEAAQIIVVLSILLLAYLMQTVFKTSKRDWILVTSSIIIGVVLHIIIGTKIL